jgi:PAS domain S-box-containing protein
MTEVEREVGYYRRKLDELGGRLLRVQRELDRARRERQRTRTAAQIIERASHLVGSSSSEDQLCEEFLRAVFSGCGVRRAMLLRHTGEVFVGRQVLGFEPEQTIRLEIREKQWPEFHFANSRSQNGMYTSALRECIGVPYLLWAYHKPSGWALLLGNSVEDRHIKRPFQAEDREIVATALNVFVEVFERRKVEEALRRSEGKYRDIFALSPEAILLLDSKGRILEANQRLCQWIGRDEDDVTGMVPWQLAALNGEAAAMVKENFHRRMAGEDPAPYEIVLDNDGESEHVLRVRARAVPNDEGELHRDLVIMSDVTDQKKTQWRLQETLDELRRTQQKVVDHERHRALAQMASGIAHDFNNSLSMIQGFTDLLLHAPENLSDEETARGYLNQISKAVSMAAETVSRMRKFYRPGTDEPHRSLDLNRLIEEALSLTEPQWKEQARARDAHIEVQRDFQQIPPIRGSEAELHEMLTNIVFNAVDAMPGGGTLRFRTTCEGDHVLLEISDTGIGMTETERKRCLEPFFTTKGDAGTGLGLATVHGIIKRHDGSIDLQSEIGEGTTFRIRLPQASGPSEVEVEPGWSGKVERDLRILVVEDRKSQRHLLEEYLKLDGHSVDLAPGGQQALRKCREKDYDLIITDRAMPDMSGDAVSHSIKSRDPGIPIIMLTGFGRVMEASGETVETVDVLLSKPATLQQIRRAVAEALEEAPSES